MGGGTSKLHSKAKRSIEKKYETPSLFSYDSGNSYSTKGQSAGFIQPEYASDNKPVSYFEEPIIDATTLFLIICYFVRERLGDAKNKKLRDFLDKFGEMISNKNNLVNSSEFKNFRKYCSNKSIQQYYGYEVVRRFLTKYFSDSSGVFMKIKRDEWVQYVNQFLKK